MRSPWSIPDDPRIAEATADLLFPADLTLLAERDSLSLLGHPFYDRDSEATEVAQQEVRDV
jgi:hypothetical protein